MNGASLGLQLLLNLKAGRSDRMDQLTKLRPLEAEAPTADGIDGWARELGVLTVERIDVRRGFEVAGFDMAGADHSAHGKHV